MDIKDILLDMHHQLITVDEAEIKMRNLAMESIRSCYINPQVPDDIPQDVFAFNEAVNSCYQLFCTHEPLQLINDTNGRNWERCTACGYAKEIVSDTEDGYEYLFGKRN